MKNPLNGRRYPQVRCTESGDWYDQQGKLVATSAQMLAFYNHERANGRIPHFYPRAALAKPAPSKTTASAPKARPTTAPRAKDSRLMTQSQRAKRERDQLVANYSASELKAANQIMQLWAQQAAQGTLPKGADTSIAAALKIARKQPGVTPKEPTGGVLRGSRFYVGGRPPEGGA